MSTIHESSPEWLAPWLEIPFFEEKCEKHAQNFLTVFCGECMGKHFCKRCWKDKSKEHEGHPILKVCRASRRPAIKLKEMQRLRDISHIQPYRINGKYILFLNPNLRVVGEQTNNPKCEICNRKIMDLKYKFCSIACKSKSIECGTQTTGSTDPESAEPTIKRKNSECFSFRKKSRKGIPQRAPLK